MSDHGTEISRPPVRLSTIVLSVTICTTVHDCSKVIDGSEIEGLEGLRTYLLTTRREAFLKQSAPTKKEHV